MIGLFGQMAAAKDTVANHLVYKLNENNTVEDRIAWKRLGFADAVKKVFMDSFNVDWDFIENWKRKDEVPPTFDITVRKALQQIGDGFRKIQGDVWIRTALRNKDNVVISDGRYLNEAAMIKQKGGVNILLWRPGFENNDPNPSESQIRPYVEYCKNHCDEGPIKFNIQHWIDDCVAELIEFDYFLVNDGTLDTLQSKINEKLLPYLKERL